jgi:hypothetical protein
MLRFDPFGLSDVALVLIRLFIVAFEAEQLTIVRRKLAGFVDFEAIRDGMVYLEPSRAPAPALFAPLLRRPIKLARRPFYDLDLDSLCELSPGH